MNLTEISIAIRKFFIWLVIVLIMYFVIKFLIGLFIALNTKPIPLPLPDIRFNKLPAPTFTTTTVSTSSSGLKFTLENVDGHPPETTPSAKVYVMPKKLPSILSEERAKKMATKLGFTNEPEINTPTLYHFTYPSDPLWSLDIDITNLNFKLKYDYQKNLPVINLEGGLRTEDALSYTKNYIQNNGLFDGSIIGGKASFNTFIFDPVFKTFSPATSISTTNAVRINFLRNDIDLLKVLPPAFDQSYNYALYVSTTSPSRILELNYTFWPIAFDDFGTYPLRSGTTAWHDLIDGYAYVVKIGNNTPDRSIVIRNIYLAYYDSDEPQQYIQPIFVFEGDNGFVAYLPAIDSEQLE